MINTRICNHCMATISEQDQRCPHCGNEIDSKKETRTCDIHGIHYDIWVNAAGEHLSGFCPLCLENEDLDLDKEIQVYDERIQKLETIQTEIQKNLARSFLTIPLILLYCFLVPVLALLGAYILSLGLKLDFLISFIVLFVVLDLFLFCLPMLRRIFRQRQLNNIEKQLELLKKEKKETIQRKLENYVNA